MASTKQTKATPTRASASAKVVTPNALAAEIFGEANAYKMGKQVRASLRSRFPRKPGERNASWHLNAAQVKHVRDAFATHPLKLKRAKRAAAKPSTKTGGAQAPSVTPTP